MKLEDFPALTRTWLACPRPNPAARSRLVCLHHAGGSPSSFRPWLPHLPPSVELVPVRLAGREARLRETPARRTREIVEPLAEALAPVLEAGPVIVFGHSLGALLGFELARQLRRAGHPLPKTLILSGRNAPDRGRKLELHKLRDRELIEEVQRIYGGIPRQILDEPELLALTLPVLRADLEVNETYELTDEAPLDCPLEAYGGVDDPHVGKAGLAGWAAYTQASFVSEQCEGDHFYLAKDPGRSWLLAKIAAAIDR